MPSAMQHSQAQPRVAMIMRRLHLLVGRQLLGIRSCVLRRRLFCVGIARVVRIGRHSAAGDFEAELDHLAKGRVGSDAVKKFFRSR